MLIEALRNVKIRRAVQAKARSSPLDRLLNLAEALLLGVRDDALPLVAIFFAYA